MMIYGLAVPAPALVPEGEAAGAEEVAAEEAEAVPARTPLPAVPAQAPIEAPVPGM